MNGKLSYIDTRKMTFEERQNYVIKCLKEMGIRLEPGERQPGDGDYSTIIPSTQTLIFK
ncbi:hypothetical protein [Heyndrickxia oleronia]|jgi:hypothetical protein|uniref:hypothetical protein n=1 Tax=Heyndrickxia oleronia TaxID=38875 RepID=UPI00242A653E|nr:hypothetical protein [Heyndrickxia oleronia]MCI1763633.1 hypothetical protein [Heyndrickxia oleronia]